MDKETRDLQEILTDLKLIKEAISKRGSIISFMDTGEALKGILMAGGLLILTFSAAFYYLLQQYGSLKTTPEVFKVVLFLLAGLALFCIGCVKVRNFLRGAQRIRSDMTICQLMKEFYTLPFLALLLPTSAAIILVIVFLFSQGYYPYIVPSLAVLIGFLTIFLSSLFFMREIYLLGLWLVATGVLILFFAEAINLLAALVITFAAGFILASLFLYLGPPKRGSGHEH